MKRRDFLRNTTAAGTIPLLLGGGIPVRTMGASFKTAATCDISDRSLVIVYLNGANDVYNTVVGLNEYGNYANARPTIRLPQNQLITLDSSLPANRQLGLHPVLTSFKSLYDAGKFSIVQRVGYPSPNQSHFASLDYMLKGRDGQGQGPVPNNTGWMGRFLQNRFPNYQGIPFEGEQDPLGLLMSGLTDTGFHTQEEHRMEIRLNNDPGGYFDLINSVFGDPLTNIPNTENGGKLNYINTIDLAANLYAQRISDTYNLGSNSSVNYPSSSLGNQMRTVARMLSGGIRTKVFLTSTGGWDNHNDQVQAGNTGTGRHADLLRNLGDSVKAFQDDLENLGIADNVLTVIFSEFGRKARENGNIGTDHGTLNCIFSLGNGAQSGVIGDNLDFTDINNQGAISAGQLQNDYRTCFGTILQDWMGADNTALGDSFPGMDYTNKPNIINNNAIVDSNCYWVPAVQNVVWNVGAKLYLEGYYDEGLGEMRQNLMGSNLVPTSQPYNMAPFNYAGNESASTFPADTVDWVLVELRDASDLDLLVATKAVLIRNDGMLMEPDGTLGINFVNIPSGFYHLAIFHRSHLAVLSAGSLSTNQTTPFVDLTTSASSAYSLGSPQVKEINGSGVFALHVGDYDSNGIINNLDFNAWKQDPAPINVYYTTDGDGNGIINNQDFNWWKRNGSVTGLQTIRK